MLKKIIIGIVAIFMIVIISGISTILIFRLGINTQHPSKEVIAKSHEPKNKEALIVYQNSKSQFPEEIATSLASGLNNKGYNVTINTAGDFLSRDVSKYDVIILGGAVLAGNMGEPLKKYATEIDNYNNSKIVLFSTGAMTENITEIDKLASLLKKDPIKKIKFDYTKKDESKTTAILVGEEIGSN